MRLTRRNSFIAAGLLPLQVKAALAREAGGSVVTGAIQPGMPPALPDKASFPELNGVYLNAAGIHPEIAGATELGKKALAAEAGDSSGFKPDRNRVRGYFAKLINADLDEIAFVPTTSAGESFVCSALGLHEKGVHIVSDVLHFVGAQYMYVDMARRGAEVSWVQMKNGRIMMEDLDKAIVKGKTKLVAVSAVCFVNGFQHDLKRVCEIAHAKGALVHADIIQAAGAVPLDVKDCGVDTASAATYKWMMSEGTAFLYVRKGLLAQMRPPYYHWTQLVGTPDNNITTHIFPFDAPAKEIVDGFVHKDGAIGMFSMGYNPSTRVLGGLEYSLPYILNIGVDKIQAHAQPLITRLKDELPKRGYPLLTPVDNHSPIVACAVENAKHLAPAMDAANIKVTLRWNHLRLATSVYNDMADIDRFLAALPKAT